MEKEPITVNGLQNLKLELEDLKNVQRPKIVEAIAEARSHGDLKENAEYHAAKEQQALIESRIIVINDIIARANVIDVTKIENNGKVIFGSTVKVQDLETDKKISYRLVGQDEADIKKNLIFFKSPIGKALIESRVIAINDIIARANVIDVTKIENNGKVIFGSTVKVLDLETDKKISYRLVGQDEADIKKNLIFFKSPIGKALIGKNKGEIISVNTPSGERNFEILEVEYI